MFLKKSELREIVRRQVPRIVHTGNIDVGVLKQDEDTRKTRMGLKQVSDKIMKELGY